MESKSLFCRKPNYLSFKLFTFSMQIMFGHAAMTYPLFKTQTDP